MRKFFVRPEQEVTVRAQELADMIPNEEVFSTVESLYEARQKGLLDSIRTLTLTLLSDRLKDQLK